jgi:hypothetical protein
MQMQKQNCKKQSAKSKNYKYKLKRKNTYNNRQSAANELCNLNREERFEL